MTYNEYKERTLTNPEVKAEYDALKPEYDSIKAKMDLEKNINRKEVSVKAGQFQDSNK